MRQLEVGGSHATAGLCVPSCHVIPLATGSTRVDWPTNTSDSDKALLLDARVVAADSSEGLEFPHRSIQEYFGAIAVLDELGNSPAVSIEASSASRPARTASGLLQEWHEAKLAGVPREIVLALLLSEKASPKLQMWALDKTDWRANAVSLEKMEELEHIRVRSSPASGLPLPPASVTGALSDAANDVLRQLVAALIYRPPAGLCNRLLSAMAVGCDSAVLCDFLGDCVPLLPAGCAPKLAFRAAIEKAVAAFWSLQPAPSVSTVQMLRHTFWSLADATTGGAQTRRALDAIRACLSLAAPAEPACSTDADTISRACAAAAIVGSVAHTLTPELLAEAHSVITLASQSPVEALAAEAIFAGTVLDPLLGATPESLRERLLKLSRPTLRGPVTATVNRAASELALRFAGDSVVRTTLKLDAERGFLTPFVEACIKGPGLALISSEIALVLFKWLETNDCTRLAMRMWDPLGDPNEAVAAGLSPEYIAAARARSDFIAVFANQNDADIAAAVNGESLSGTSSTLLNVTGSRTFCNSDAVSGAVIDCADILIAAGARWGRPLPNVPNVLHAAAYLGSLDTMNRLLSAPGACRDIVNSSDAVSD